MLSVCCFIFHSRIFFIYFWPSKLTHSCWKVNIKSFLCIYNTFLRIKNDSTNVWREVVDSVLINISPYSSQLCFYLKDIFKVVRPFLAATGLNEVSWPLYWSRVLLPSMLTNQSVVLIMATRWHQMICPRSACIIY